MASRNDIVISEIIIRIHGNKGNCKYYRYDLFGFVVHGYTLPLLLALYCTAILAESLPIRRVS